MCDKMVHFEFMFHIVYGEGASLMTLG